MPRERGDWIGDALFHLVHFVARFNQCQEKVTMTYAPDPEPQWRWCHDCESHTVWDGYNWVLEGAKSYECSQCGAVS